jgi:hypothetical protein
MEQVVTDILHGPVQAYYANVGTAGPADTVAAGGAWPAGWSKTGLTADTLKFAYEFDTKDVHVQEELAPVDRYKTKENLKAETVIAQLSLEGIALAWGVTLSTTAPGAGQPGKETVVAGNVAALPKKKWGFEGSYVDEDGATFPVRLYIHIATAVAGGQLEFGVDKEAGVPLKLSALADRTQAIGERLFKIDRILEPATS